MKNIFLLSLLLLVNCTIARAHAFYFAFSEISFDEIGQRIEATLIVTAHDLDLTFESEKCRIKSEGLNKEDCIKQVEAYLNGHFLMEKGDYRTRFKIEGYEIKREGTIEFYLSSEWKPSFENILFTFNLLMKQFPEQQNKALIIWRNQKKTLEFLPNKTQHLILFE